MDIGYIQLGGSAGMPHRDFNEQLPQGSSSGVGNLDQASKVDITGSDPTGSGPPESKGHNTDCGRMSSTPNTESINNGAESYRTSSNTNHNPNNNITNHNTEVSYSLY